MTTVGMSYNRTWQYYLLGPQFLSFFLFFRTKNTSLYTDIYATFLVLHPGATRQVERPCVKVAKNIKEYLK
jgi:hypothetical protein